jgi:SAM-dependent methyltransferase
MAVRSLNLGCGRDIRPASEGWVNMDIAKLDGVDVVHDLFDLPWPLESGSFDHALASHVLEHVPHQLPADPSRNGLVLVMEEIHRILRPGGTVVVRAPHPEAADAWADPTHTRVLHPKTFEYFAEGKFGYYTRARFTVDAVRVTRRTPVAPYFLPMGKGGLGLTMHLFERAPFLRPLLCRRPAEMTVRLTRV